MAVRFSEKDTLLGTSGVAADGRNGFVQHVVIANPYDTNGAPLPTAESEDGGLAPGFVNASVVFPQVYNGTTYDRMRGDVNGTVIQPALSTAFWNYAPPVGGIVNSTAGVTARVAGGAGVRNYIKSLQLTADTLGAATEFVIRDGAGGTVLARIKINTAGLTASGTTIFDPPLRGTANTLVEIQTVSATVTGGVFANLQGYTGA